MKKKIILGISFLITILALSSCNINEDNNVTDFGDQSQYSIPTGGNNVTTTIVTSQDKNAINVIDNPNTGEFVITTEDGNYTTLDNKTYNITKAGTYKVSGYLEEGNIIISATEDDKVYLELNGVYIKSTETSPISAKELDKLVIKSLEETTNVIVDERKSTSDTDGNAAIYAECDLNISGKGELYVYGYNNNGIHTKDDLEIKNVTLNVVAVNNALKGNDSVEIQSGTLNIISTDGDAIKTTNSSISSKGNQKGSVVISGGDINLYASEDGIDAEYNVEISEDANLNIFTDSYSVYTGSTTSESSVLYVRIPSKLVSGYRYALYLYNDDSESGTFKTLNQLSQSGRSSYYYYQATLDSSYKNIVVFRYKSSQSENSITTYDARSEGQTINTSKNLFVINSISNNIIKVDWGTYQTSSSGGSMIDKSSKGIKGNNEINITGGNILIYSTDDGVHANNDEALENNEKAVGNINIEGGNITITSGDDGMHADGNLIIKSGTINVIKSYEGLEGYNVYINGDSIIYVYATDDGINASKLIQVEGGAYVDVTVPSGDTDGIDSNGNYIQKGGLVISRCAASDSSGNMAALDIDGTFTITGGTYIGVGPIAELPSSSSINYIKFGSGGGGMGGGPGFGGFGRGSSSSNFSFGSGNWTLKTSDGTIIATIVLKQSYTNMLIASASLNKNSSYVLTNGTTNYNWTQTSQAQSYS